MIIVIKNRITSNLVTKYFSIQTTDGSHIRTILLIREREREWIRKIHKITE